ncbi:hypothetical protein ACIQ69_01980 [Bacillus paramycoides]|uniref:hypothetical protein n=1 Tax=Bacillus paramycoides TaxID=2026194 RepID=UPI003830D181
MLKIKIKMRIGFKERKKRYLILLTIALAALIIYDLTSNVYIHLVAFLAIMPIVVAVLKESFLDIRYESEKEDNKI